MKAFILAAGMGKRLKPLTDFVPKALAEINGKPLIEILLKKLKSFGIEDVIINIHHKGEQIRSFLADHKSFGMNIKISDESEKLLGTGGALKKAAEFFEQEDAILVHNVDILSDTDFKKLFDCHFSKNTNATLVVRNRESSRVLLFSDELQLCGWKNKKENLTRIANTLIPVRKELAFSGIQVLNPEIFKYFPEGDVFSLIDLYLLVAAKEKIYGYQDDESFWIDAGRKETLEEASGLFGVRDNGQV